jgi:hypothetical protein
MSFADPGLAGRVLVLISLGFRLMRSVLMVFALEMLLAGPLGHCLFSHNGSVCNRSREGFVTPYRRRFFAIAALGRALGFGGSNGSGRPGDGSSLSRIARSALTRGANGKPIGRNRLSQEADQFGMLGIGEIEQWHGADMARTRREGESARMTLGQALAAPGGADRGARRAGIVPSPTWPIKLRTTARQ